MIEKEKILDLIKNKPITAEELAKEYFGDSAYEKEFFGTLAEMEKNGELMYTSKGKAALPSDLGFTVGEIVLSARELYVKVDGTLYKAFKNADKTMPGDLVLAKIDKKRGGIDIERVLKRGNSEYVGLVQKRGRDFEFIPQKMRFSNKIYVSKNFHADIKDDYKVKALVYPTKKGYFADIVKVYGDSRYLSVNYEAILDRYSIEKEFDERTISYAESTAQRYFEEGLKEADREDLRDTLIFTIDPADAKDLDDAISLSKTETGYHLGVHIADVSHFVREGTPTETAAFNRGTSVYFADMVVPMLPEAISNGVCSLNENEDKLAISCLMELDQKGEITEYKIKKSIIRSRKKCSYTDINALLGGTASEELKEAYAAVIPALPLLTELSDILETKRKNRGAIDFETTESKIILDKDNYPIDIIPRTRGDSERYIESFMLAANECTAKFVFWQSLPYVYRVHDNPDPEKIRSLERLSRKFGCTVKLSGEEIYSGRILKMLEFFKGTKYEIIISTLTLRSMAKAKYSDRCTGHFGLALKHYCHFTSPIRRYPDLICHRIITKILRGQLTGNTLESLDNFVPLAASKSSDCELRAVYAERDIADMYKAAFMYEKIGQTFKGVITSVTPFGFYVELPNTVEGLVRLADITDDFYRFNEEELYVEGERSGKRYSLGDQVTVKCSGADIATGQIDFLPLD